MFNSQVHPKLLTNDSKKLEWKQLKDLLRDITAPTESALLVKRCVRFVNLIYINSIWFSISLDIGSGTSVDYMYAAHEIPLSYTFEFRDQGTYGFVLPPEQIIPNCQETTDAILTMVSAARELNQI